MGPERVAIYWMVHVALQESGSSTWSGFLRVPTCSRSRPFREPRPFSMSTRIFESTGHLLGVEHQAGQQHLNRRPFPPSVTAPPQSVLLLGLSKGALDDLPHAQGPF